MLLLCVTSAILSTSAHATILPEKAASPATLASIKLSEVLSNPQKDWDNDGDTGTANQWIELANTSASTVDISHLELLSHGSNNNQPVLLPATAQIAPSGFFVIFVDQISTGGAGAGGFRLFPGGQQLDIIDGDTGTTLDSVTYPALGPDLSYSRTAGGVWAITGKPTPGALNVIVTPGSPTPKPTATPRSGKGGGGGGSDGHATPTPTSFPVGSVVLPDGSALASQQNNSGTDAAGSGVTPSPFPSWLKIALLLALGAGLLVVIVWYIRSWNQEPEEEG